MFQELELEHCYVVPFLSLSNAQLNAIFKEAFIT